MAPDHIPFEIWAAVLATVDDSATLTVCARVSSTFWAAAVPWLYREIRVLHPDRGAAIRGNRAFDAVEAHPRLRAYVRSVYHDVMDMVIWRPYMRVAYNDDRWAHATPWTSFLPQLPNLTSYTLTGVFQVSRQLVGVVVDVLRQCPSLEEVHWLFEIHPTIVPLITQLKTVREVELQHPSVRTLALLGPAMQEITNLKGLHIRVTEGLQLSPAEGLLLDSQDLTALTHLTIGRGHTMSRDQLRASLRGTPNLEALDIFYDNFCHHAHDSRSFKGLSRLRHLTVRHQGVGLPTQFSEMFSWIMSIATGAPLEYIAIVSDDNRSCKSGTTNTDMALCYPTLRTLDVPHVRLLSHQFIEIVEHCRQMEYMSFLLETGSYSRFQTLVRPDHEFGKYLELPDFRKAPKHGTSARYRRGG